MNVDQARAAACPPACTCVLCARPYKFAYASILSCGECLTFDRLPAPPQHTHTHPPHLDSLYPGQLSAGTWPKRKTHLSPSFKGQGSGLCVCVCVCVWGRREASFHSVNLRCCSLLHSLAHFWGVRLLYMQTPPRVHVWCVYSVYVWPGLFEGESSRVCMCVTYLTYCSFVC